jgi:hypothetical protein
MALAWTAAETFRFGGGNGKAMVMIQGRLVITTTAVGNAADEIPASTFGLDQIYGCGGIIPDNESKVWMGAPDDTNDSLITKDPITTDVTNDLPADTYNMCVWGTTAT